MISTDAFLLIEASLTEVVRKEAGLITKELFSKVNEAALSGDFGKATALLEGLSLDSMFADSDEALSYLTNVAMLFGASRVTQGPGTSVVGLGFEAQTSKQMVMAFVQNLRLRAASHLRDVGLGFLQKVQGVPLNPSLGAEVREVIQKAEGRVLHAFSSFMDDAGQAYFNVCSSLHSSRVAAYGYTAEASALGYEEYQINEQLDNRICPVCRIMHGKVFKVKDARKLLNVVTRTTDPEMLKQLQPWPSHSKENLAELAAMSAEELVARGWHVPPFHPRCRGLLNKVGKVPSLAALEAGTVKPVYVPGPSDFSALGVKGTKEVVSKWGAALPVSPADVVAGLTGKQVDQLLVTAMESKAPAKAIGLKKLVVGDSIDLTLKAPGFGAEDAIAQKVSFIAASKTLKLLDVALPKGAGAEVFKSYMIGAYTVAKDAGMKSLSVPVAGSMSSLAFAKYGFKPRLDEWNLLRAEMMAKADDYSMFDFLPEQQAKALKTILSSTEPAYIFSLADLGFGEFLLQGKSWEGFLDLTDAESVTRFLTYVGELK